MTSMYISCGTFLRVFSTSQAMKGDCDTMREAEHSSFAAVQARCISLRVKILWRHYLANFMAVGHLLSEGYIHRLRGPYVV